MNARQLSVAAWTACASSALACAIGVGAHVIEARIRGGGYGARAPEEFAQAHAAMRRLASAAHDTAYSGNRDLLTGAGRHEKPVVQEVRKPVGRKKAAVLKVTAILSNDETGERIAIVKSGARTVSVAVGDRIDGYRVASITTKGIRVVKGRTKRFFRLVKAN